MGATQIIVFFIDALLNVLSMLILIRAILSFFARAGGAVYKIYNAIGIITEPILEPIRRLLYKIPALSGLPIDFSPIVALLLISLIRSLLSAI